jgi:solute carrier family 25 folate transporter 32
VGNASSWAIFFYFKSIIESQIRNLHSRKIRYDGLRDQDRIQLTPADYFVASGLSGLLITMTTNPIWVVKTRMLSSDRGSHGAYGSMWEGIKQISSTEGWRGFYRGLGISCLGVLHGAVQFGVYEPLKQLWASQVAPHTSRLQTDHKNEKDKISTGATLMISGLSKVIAGTATYPYQVVRSRLQTYNAEKRFGRGIRGVTGKVWREEGWRGFYRGLGPNVVRVLPATWVTFLVYENVRWWLPKWSRSER